MTVCVICLCGIRSFRSFHASRNRNIFVLQKYVDDGSGELFIPYHFQDLFEPSYYAGARIHSDSWGGGYTYDSFCLDVDEYTYTHPDFLAFFAAGNDGYHGARTILSPAMAKNAVAVGGSISSHDPVKMKVYHGVFAFKLLA